MLRYPNPIVLDIHSDTAVLLVVPVGFQFLECHGAGTVLHKVTGSHHFNLSPGVPVDGEEVDHVFFHTLLLIKVFTYQLYEYTLVHVKPFNWDITINKLVKCVYCRINWLTIYTVDDTTCPVVNEHHILAIHTWDGRGDNYRP